MRVKTERETKGQETQAKQREKQKQGPDGDALKREKPERNAKLTGTELRGRKGR